jgi:hypothetical protein
MTAAMKRPPLVTAGASSGKSLNNDQPTSTPARRSIAPRPTQQHFAVSEGRTQLGTVDLVGGRYVARDLHGDIVGKFSSLKAAAASFDGGRR